MTSNGKRVQLRRKARWDVANLEIARAARAAGRKPMCGTGCSDEDVWNPPPKRCDAMSVEDERRGKMYCVKCGDEIEHVQLDDVVSIRSLDGFPHVLTCEGED